MKKTLLLLLMLMSFASAVFAQVPTIMMYQVQVNHGESGPKDVSIEMQLRKSQNGVAIWNQVFNFTEMKNYATVNLALDLGDKFDWSDGEYWLATIIDGKEMGCAKLTSVPYAYSSKYVEGALTAEELIGKWYFHDSDIESDPDYKDKYDCEFKSDGTFTYTHTTTYNTLIRLGKWKLNGAGILYFECYREDGSFHSMDAAATYYNSEDGSLLISGGNDNIFANIYHPLIKEDEKKK